MKPTFCQLDIDLGSKVGGGGGGYRGAGRDENVLPFHGPDRSARGRAGHICGRTSFQPCMGEDTCAVGRGLTALIVKKTNNQNIITKYVCFQQTNWLKALYCTDTILLCKREEYEYRTLSTV